MMQRDSENTRIAYEPQETRRDRTPGTFPIWRSQFTAPEQICNALTRRDGVEWVVWKSDYQGGQTRTCTFAVAVKDAKVDALPLTVDSRCWYIALDHGRNWGMIDLDATEALADFDKFASTCDEQSAGARADDESTQDMRHPTW